MTSGSLYLELSPLRIDDESAALHRLRAYPHIRDVMTVPIVWLEFRALAQSYPLLWQVTDRGLEPVALGGLVPGQCLWSLFSAEGGVLPLLLMAYPLAVMESAGPSASLMVWIDKAEREADVQSDPVFTSLGKLTSQAERSAQVLQVFLSARRQTLEMSKGLMEGGLLEPWRGNVRLRDDGWRMDGLLCCRGGAEASPIFRDLFKRFGAEFGLMVECHRISLTTLQGLAHRHSARLAERR